MKRNVDILKTAKGVVRHRWTGADLDVLRDLWGTMSAREIAGRIAPGILTKSSVLAKAHYLGLLKVVQGSRPGKAIVVDDSIPKNVRPSGRNSVPKPGESVVRRPLPPAGRARTCQWPIGHPGTEEFRFCGSVEVVPGRPYCAEHMIVAYLPSDHPAYDRKARTGAHLMPVRLRST